MAQNKVYTFHMAMTCDGCANAAKRVLGKLGDDVSAVETDVNNKTVTVTSKLPAEKLLETLQKTGKEITLVSSSE